MIVIIGGFVFWFGCSLLSFFLYYFLNFLKFLIIIFYFSYFILFYFILFFPFSLSFFLPFILTRVDDRVLVLWLGIRPVPL